MQTLWYERLKQAEFNDIESGDYLNDHQSPQDFQNRTGTQTVHTFEATQNYYQWARGKATEGMFTSHRDRIIWENHAEGTPQRQIAEQVGLCQQWVQKKIKKIQGYLESGSVASMSFQLALF